MTGNCNIISSKLALCAAVYDLWCTIQFSLLHRIILIPQKRKISDLDPKWSKDELTQFYEAYRRHGKDWKKVWTDHSLNSFRLFVNIFVDVSWLCEYWLLKLLMQISLAVGGKSSDMVRSLYSVHRVSLDSVILSKSLHPLLFYWACKT